MPSPLVLKRGYDAYPDAERRRMMTNLRKYLDWLKLVNPAAAGTVPRGYIGETSIPDRRAAGYTVGGWLDSFRWTPLLAEMIDILRRNNTWLTYWTSSYSYGLQVETAYYTSGGAGASEPHAAPLLQRHFTRWPASNDLAYSGLQIGVALDDLNASGPSRDAPNRDGYDTFAWHETPDSFLDFLQARGVQLVRMTFRWARLQRDLLAAFATSTPDLQSIFTAQLTSMNTRGFKVILDQHSHLDYNYWNGSSYQTELVGGSIATITAFGDFWQRLATLVVANSGAGWGDAVVAYELSNEPADTPSTRPSDGCQRTSTLNDWDDSTVQGWGAEEAITGSANDTSLKRSGAGSWKFSRAFAAGYDQVRTRRNSAPGVDSGNPAFGAWVFLPASATGSDWNARVFAYSSGFSNYSGTTVRLYKGQWNYIAGAPVNTITSTPVLGDSTGGVGDVGIEIFCNDNPVGGQTVQLNIDDCYRGRSNSSSCVEWAMQHALTAIRSVDTTRAIIAAGNGFSNTTAYPTYHPEGPWIYDPNSRLFITGHEYHNYNASGDYSIYTYEGEVVNARNDGY